MTKIGRNDPCPCGSGKKYKNCCLAKEAQEGEKGGEKWEKGSPATPDEDNQVSIKWTPLKHAVVCVGYRLDERPRLGPEPLHRQP